MLSSSRIFFKHEMSRISYIRKFICSVCVILIGIFFVEIFNLLLVYPVSWYTSLLWYFFDWYHESAWFWKFVLICSNLGYFYIYLLVDAYIHDSSSSSRLAAEFSSLWKKFLIFWLCANFLAFYMMDSSHHILTDFLILPFLWIWSLFSWLYVLAAIIYPLYHKPKVNISSK